MISEMLGLMANMDMDPKTAMSILPSRREIVKATGPKPSGVLRKYRKKRDNKKATAKKSRRANR